MVDVALLDESARLDLSVSAMNQFMEAILPLQVSDNGAQNGVLQSVKYCKADGDHVATLVAYGSLQGGADNSGVAVNPVSHLKGPLDCSMSADLNRQRQSALGARAGFLCNDRHGLVPMELTLEDKQRRSISCRPSRRIYFVNSEPSDRYRKPNGAIQSCPLFSE